MRSWLPQAERRHTQAATALIAATCLLTFAPPGLAAQALLLLVGVALVGMPHGAFDHLVAAPLLRPRLGPGWWLWFGAGYLALAGVVGLGWLLAPAPTLAIFLLLSVLHFGLGDTEPTGDRVTASPARRIFAVLARGGLPILLPITLQSATVVPILAALAAVDPVPMAAIVDASRWLLLPWAACVLVWLPGATAMERYETAAVSAAFVLVPPVLAFALYFCVCHSVRHLLRLGALLAPDNPRAASWRVLQVAVPAGVLCLVATPLLTLQGVEGAIVPIIRGLAALTLPHMAVTSFLEPAAMAMASRGPEAAFSANGTAA